LSLRHQWKFPYKAADISKAAAKRTAYHEGRIAYWQEQKVKAEAELKEEPEVADQFAKAYSNTRSVNNTRVFDCAQKVGEHEEAVLKLKLYARALQTNATANYDLDAEDVDFFGL
jgi:hypothetical protein